MPQVNRAPFWTRWMERLRKTDPLQDNDLESATSSSTVSTAAGQSDNSYPMSATSEFSSSTTPTCTSMITMPTTSNSNSDYYWYCGLCIHKSDSSFGPLLKREWRKIFGRLVANMRTQEGRFNVSLQVTSRNPYERTTRTILMVCANYERARATEIFCSQLDWLQDFATENELRIIYAVAPDAMQTASEMTSFDTETGSDVMLIVPENANTLCGAQFMVRSSCGKPYRRSTVGGIVAIGDDLYAWATRHTFDIDLIQSALDEATNPATSDQNCRIQKLTRRTSAIRGKITRLINRVSPSVEAVGKAPIEIVLDLDDVYFSDQNSQTDIDYDWYLFKLSDMPSNLRSQVLLPNRIGERLIQDALPYDKCSSGTVSILTAGLLMVQGELNSMPEVLVSGSSIYLATRITLDCVLERGCSGAWVIQDGMVAGYLVAARTDVPWAYMVSMQEGLKDIQQQLGVPARIATLNDIARFANIADRTPVSELRSSQYQEPDLSGEHSREPTLLHSKKSILDENSTVSSSSVACDGRSPDTKNRYCRRDDATRHAVIPTHTPQVHQIPFVTTNLCPEGSISTKAVQRCDGFEILEKCTMGLDLDAPSITLLPENADCLELAQWLSSSNLNAAASAHTMGQSSMRILMIQTNNDFFKNVDRSTPMDRDLSDFKSSAESFRSEYQDRALDELFRRTGLPIAAVDAYLRSQYTFAGDAVGEFVIRNDFSPSVSRYYCSTYSWCLVWTYFHESKATSAICFYQEGSEQSSKQALLSEITRLRDNITHPLCLGYIFAELESLKAFNLVEQISTETFRIEENVGLARWDFLLDREIKGSLDRAEDPDVIRTTIERYNIIAGKTQKARYLLRVLGDQISWLRRTNMKLLEGSNDKDLVKVCRELDNMLHRMSDFGKIYLHDVETLRERISLQMGTISHHTAQRDSKVDLAIADLNMELACQSKNMNLSMMSIAFSSMLFLPLTFVASVFDAPIFNFVPARDGAVVGQPFWMFWLACGLTTGIICLGWYFYTKRKRHLDWTSQQHHQRDICRSQLSRSKPLTKKSVAAVPLADNQSWFSFWQSGVGEKSDLEKGF